ncbi:MAG TPA: holo-ACP synthase [Firmicutes bacterium]|nr:holo-ACP synthase [Bacillota bacterium]
MVVKGIGIDLIEVERIRRAVNRRPAGFRRRVFTPAEWEYCNRGGSIDHAALAARFAAKEAVFKALGCGWRQIPWQEVEIRKGAQGEPLVRLGPRAQALAREKGIEEILLSLSHTRGHAVAQVVAQGKE